MDWEQCLPWELHQLRLKPGQYYPRIARPTCAEPYETPGICPAFETYQNEFASLAGQLSALIRRLQQVCETIYPRDANLHAYGHEIRNLLILGCTEVETHWRGILEANVAGTKPARWTTNDYVKLTGPLGLKSYQATFPGYPWLNPVSPFANWNASDPTKSLDWYAAYNAVKHDREGNFKDARLEYAFHAVAACAILLVAQFGSAPAFQWHPALQFLQLDQTPQWFPADFYIPPYHSSGAAGWTPINYQF